MSPGRALWAVWARNSVEPWGWCSLWTGWWPWPWPFSLCEKGHSWRRARTRQVSGPKECLELRIKALWKSHLKNCSLCSYSQPLGGKKTQKKKKKSISYFNLTTSESLWSTFLLVLQGKIISPLALKGKLDQLCEKPKMMYFINFKLVPRLSPTLC